MNTDTIPGSCPPSYTPEKVFAIWSRLTPRDIDLVQWCLRNHPGLTVGECLLELHEIGGL